MARTGTNDKKNQNQRIRNRSFINPLQMVTTTIIIIIVVFGRISTAEDDVRCLRGVKSSLDTQGKLSWNFDNTTIGFICRFVGASCWNEWENRLIELRLSNMTLSGQIPDSLQFCGSINHLDLSGNSINGQIPAGICDWLPYLVTLDLSGNRLSGPIPPELNNCKFLNTLRLNDNDLSGTIPYQLSRLNRLKKLSVANNRLSGTIPYFLSSSDPADFEGNDLCGRPLGSKCGGLSKIVLVTIITAVFCGCTLSLLLGFRLWLYCLTAPVEEPTGDSSAWS